MVSLKFENVLNSVSLISSYTINSFSNKEIIYKIIFNSTPNKFFKFNE